MTNDTLKYQKRSWHKVSKAIVVESGQDARGFSYVLFAISKKKMLRCGVFTSTMKQLLPSLRPNDKLTIWFSVESKKVGEKYFNNVNLMYFERPKPKYKEPKPDQQVRTLDFGNGSNEFE